MRRPLAAPCRCLAPTRAAKRHRGARGVNPRAGKKARCKLIIGRAKALAHVAADDERARAAAHLGQPKEEIEAASANRAPGPIESDVGAYPDVSDAVSNVPGLADVEIDEAASKVGLGSG